MKVTNVTFACNYSYILIVTTVNVSVSRELSTKFHTLLYNFP